jgi:outer membrane protein assembly factor BamE (lipoprotein component of BamABCDE complex)
MMVLSSDWRGEAPSGRGWRRCVSVLLLAALGLAAAGCNTPVQVRGHVTDPESIEAIKEGEYTEEDVLALLGTPSTVSTFDDHKWYYIGYRSSQFAFELPDVLERNVLEVSFDDSGVVNDKQVFSLEDGREIDFVSRVTPTEGREFTILQQILGNIGRLPGTTGHVPKIPGG